MTDFLVFTRDGAGQWRPMPGQLGAPGESEAAAVVRGSLDEQFKLIPVEAVDGLLGKYATHTGGAALSSPGSGRAGSSLGSGGCLAMQWVPHGAGGK